MKNALSPALAGPRKWPSHRPGPRRRSRHTTAPPGGLERRLMLDAAGWRRALAIPVQMQVPDARHGQGHHPAALAFRTSESRSEGIRATFDCNQRRASYRSEMGLFWVDDAS